MIIYLQLDPMALRDIEWATLNCKFGYNVQGIFMGSTDSGFINCVTRSYNKKLLCSGDDDRFLNLYNYPCISESPNVKSYWYYTIINIVVIQIA